MNDEKQIKIKEIAKDIPFLNLEREVFVSLDRKEKHSWMLSEEDTVVIAEALYDKGYRKESEIVKELLTKIRREFKKSGILLDFTPIAEQYDVEVQ